MFGFNILLLRAWSSGLCHQWHRPFDWLDWQGQSYIPCCTPAAPKSGGCAVFHWIHQAWIPGNSPVLLVAGQCSSTETIAALLVVMPVRLWSKIACSGTFVYLLSLICYVPTFRPKAVFLCGRHDRIISTWHRFTIIIYNSRKKVLLFSTNDRT